MVWSAGLVVTLLGSVVWIEACLMRERQWNPGQDLR